MFITIFQEWLCEFDYQVTLKYGSQRILLLLNNYKSYKVKNLIPLHIEI